MDEPSDQRAVRVLQADPTLAHGLPPVQLPRATARALAPQLALQSGTWTPPSPPQDSEHLGFLVLEGALARDVDLRAESCTELIGKGDVIRPWEAREGSASVPTQASWSVLQPTRLAVLDARFAHGIGPWPTIIAALLDRCVRRSQDLSMHFAITCLTGVELRLELLFWHFADRWGKVEGEGVIVPLALTHDMLARLARARRPTVTRALGELRKRGVLQRRDDGWWILRGDPPPLPSTADA